jgi:sulfatase maturation enzyme AslB (radical SAM superfamily)
VTTSPELPSATFCVLPWIHLASTVDGVWGRCCFDATNDYDLYYRESDAPDFRLHEDAIGCLRNSRYAAANPDRVMGPAEAFNSPALRRTRLQMLDGDAPRACYSCFDQEALGVESHRSQVNRRFRAKTNFAALAGHTASDGTSPEFPFYLDLRFGNTCNLSCIMCSFPISSRLGAGRAPSWSPAVINPYRDDTELWTELREQCQNIRYIYVAGGEPFLQNDHFRLLSLLIEEDVAQHVSLQYNTNLTVVPEEALTLLDHFGEVVLGASCDGTGELFETIRVGARWSHFVANLHKVKQRFTVSLDVTVQRDNVHALRELIAFADGEGVEIRFENILQSPAELSVRAIPTPSKDLQHSSLVRLAAECVRAGRAVLADQITRIDQYMVSER